MNLFHLFRQLAVLSVVFGSMINTSYASTFSNVALAFAKQDFDKAVLALEEQMKACNHSGSSYDVSELKKLDLDKLELVMVLRYFYTQHHLECIKPSLGDFYVALQSMNSLQPGNAQINETAKLFESDLAKYYQYKVRYIQLDEAMRKQIDNMELLKQPFNYYQVSKALGLVE